MIREKLKQISDQDLLKALERKARQLGSISTFLSLIDDEIMRRTLTNKEFHNGIRVSKFFPDKHRKAIDYFEGDKWSQTEGENSSVEHLLSEEDKEKAKRATKSIMGRYNPNQEPKS